MDPTNSSNSRNSQQTDLKISITTSVHHNQFEQETEPLPPVFQTHENKVDTLRKKLPLIIACSVFLIIFAVAFHLSVSAGNGSYLPPIDPPEDIPYKSYSFAPEAESGEPTNNPQYRLLAPSANHQSDVPLHQQQITDIPSDNPSGTPRIQTDNPSSHPLNNPSGSPEKQITANPSDDPSHSPDTQLPSNNPSNNPQSVSPSDNPSNSPQSASPSDNPSGSPQTGNPSDNPSGSPQTDNPSGSPEKQITDNPSGSPQTDNPSGSPKKQITDNPSNNPQSATPSDNPSNPPQSASPSDSPTKMQPTTWTGQEIDMFDGELFEGIGKWYNCPAGYVVAGFYQANNCAYMSCLDKMKCIKPNTAGIISTICQEIDITSDFGYYAGTAQCPDDHFVNGIWSNDNTDLYQGRLYAGIDSWDKLNCCKYDKHKISVDAAMVEKDWDQCMDAHSGAGEWCLVYDDQFITGFRKRVGQGTHSLEAATTRKVYLN